MATTSGAGTGTDADTSSLMNSYVGIDPKAWRGPTDSEPPLRDDEIATLSRATFDLDSSPHMDPTPLRDALATKSPLGSDIICRLVFEKAYEFSTSDVNVIAELDHSSITSVEVQNAQKLGTNDIWSFLATLGEGLTVLTLEGAENADDGVFEMLKAFCPNIAYVRITGGVIAEEGMKNVGGGCLSKLRELVLYDNKFVTEDAAKDATERNVGLAVHTGTMKEDGQRKIWYGGKLRILRWFEKGVEMETVFPDVAGDLASSPADTGADTEDAADKGKKRQSEPTPKDEKDKQEDGPDEEDNGKKRKVDSAPRGTDLSSASSDHDAKEDEDVKGKKRQRETTPKEEKDNQTDGADDENKDDKKRKVDPAPRGLSLDDILNKTDEEEEEESVDDILRRLSGPNSAGDNFPGGLTEELAKWATARAENPTERVVEGDPSMKCIEFDSDIEDKWPDSD